MPSAERRRLGDRVRGALARTFASWETEILRPIIVAVGTALFLFLFSLMFTRVRTFLFGGGADYPLYCTAEGSKAPDGQSLVIEFLIVNTTDDRFTRAQLEQLVPKNDSPLSHRSPDIELTYTQQRGQVLDAHEDKEFNTDKGSVRVSRAARSVTVAIDAIQPRAVMRVIIHTSPTVPLFRAAKGLVPFNVEDYEAGCYRR